MLHLGLPLDDGGEPLDDAEHDSGGCSRKVKIGRHGQFESLFAVIVIRPSRWRNRELDIAREAAAAARFTSQGETRRESDHIRSFTQRARFLVKKHDSSAFFSRIEVLLQAGRRDRNDPGRASFSVCQAEISLARVSDQGGEPCDEHLVSYFANDL